MSAKVVAIGDSLTQGFLSGSISKTHLSYPALIAQALGENNFKTPDFSGANGLPFNIEALLHRLAYRYGDAVQWFEALPAGLTVRRFLDIAEDYWERGEGSQASDSGPLHHNLAVWGFQLGDANILSESLSRRQIPKPTENYAKQIPEHSLYRTVRRTMNPSFSPQYQSLSAIGVAQKIAEVEGGIDNLLVWLGSNHCLGTVIRLDIHDSTEADLERLPHERKSNLWRPQDFEVMLKRVAESIAKIDAKHVFVATVPHVTIPPISRGVTPGTASLEEAVDEDGYFEYYTHLWVWDEHFRADRHPHLDRSEIRQIDATIDEYNQLIRAEAEKRGWHVVEMVTVLDQLAFRRRKGSVAYEFPEALVTALKANPKTRNRVTETGKVLLDTRYLRTEPEHEDASKRYQGGLFSLDGVHPSTIGYGLTAYEFLKVMQAAWEANGEQVDLKPLDWERIIASDSLMMNPPPNLSNLRDTLGFLYSQTPLLELVELFGGSGSFRENII